MKNDRLRIQVDVAYVEALGRASFVFASAEWIAVYCCEKMQPNYIQSVRKKTAGNIADDLNRLAGRLRAGSEKKNCIAAAIDFGSIVRMRNDLVHANPGTAPTGEQQLFRYGTAWTVDAINDVADEFARCAIELNNIYYKVLK